MTPESRPALLLLALLLAAAIATAEPNYVIIVPDPGWAAPFEPLVDWLEAHGDREGDRAWEVEVVHLTDTEAARAYIGERDAALQASGGGELFGMLVGDPSHLDHFEQLQIHAPEIAGADLGWGDHVPSWDNYNDADGDGIPETIIWPLPAQTLADCQAYVEKSLDHRASIERRTRSVPDHLAKVVVLCEDVDRDGRPGDLVREHGLIWRAMWEQGGFTAVYQGDDHPYDYFAREAVADALLNDGLQVFITGGTTANKVNLVYFMDQRQDPGWSVAHLDPDHRYYVHFALSCAHHAVDRADNPDFGRPHAEQVLFATGRGAVVSLGFTRQAYQWVTHWMAEASFTALMPRLINQEHGASTGRMWRDARVSFLAAHPSQGVQAASFYGMGDPSLCVVPAAQAPISVRDDAPALSLSVSVAPNPFNPRTTIRFTLPREEEASLDVFDVRGRRVTELLPRTLRSAGHQALEWDGRNARGEACASGVYFARLRTSGESTTARLVLVR